MEKPKVIKFTPYRGENEEIVEGFKTKLSLFENRLEYVVKFTQKVTVVLIDDTSSKENQKEVNNHCDETGFILKNDINSICKFIDTGFNQTDGEPYSIHKVEINYPGSQTTFAFNRIEDKEIIYKELYNWKLGINE